MEGNSLNLGHQAAQDPFAKWSNFQDVFVLSDQSLSDITSAASGSLRKDCGESLIVKRITGEMLKDNAQLASAIHAMAMSGQLGFITAGGNLQFRADIASKLGDIRSFKVLNAGSTDLDSAHVMEARIESVEADEYHSLAKTSFAPHMDLEVHEAEGKEIEPEVEEHIHKEPEEASKHSPSFAKPVAQVAQKAAEAQHIAKMQIAEQMIAQMRAAEANRREKAREVREADAKEERDQVKQDTLKREIKNGEIKNAELKTSYQRADRNYGDQAESITNASTRGASIVQAGSKAKEAAKRKAADVDASHPATKKQKS